MDIITPMASAVKPVVIHNADEHYRLVNAQWPGDRRLLRPSPQEAVAAARRLYRVATGEAWKGPVKLTSGNRNTWVRRTEVKQRRNGKLVTVRASTLIVNPTQGWGALVHDLSHWCIGITDPRSRPHDGRHARLETRLIRYVVEHGWLDGKLRRPEKQRPEKPPLRERNHARVLARIATWEKKLTEAKAAQKKAKKMLIELRAKGRRYSAAQ